MDGRPLISIVDDDASVREAMEALMRSLGCEADAFPSAEDFLGSGRMHETACVVADVQMPGLGGLELQRRLAAAGLRVPIVFVTAYPDARIRAKALEAGALGFLTKPVSERDLLACIEAAVGGPGTKAP